MPAVSLWPCRGGGASAPARRAGRAPGAAGLGGGGPAPPGPPPVCRIMDYGKYRYEQSRKSTKGQKSHQQKLKEIRVRPKTGVHDVDTKINQARKFLEHKDKVLVNVLFRGRELQHIEEGRRIIDGILEKLADVCKIEKAPSMEGKRMTAMLAPKA